MEEKRKRNKKKKRIENQRKPQATKLDTAQPRHSSDRQPHRNYQYERIKCMHLGE
jgi:hypothetical protein